MFSRSGGAENYTPINLRCASSHDIAAVAVVHKKMDTLQFEKEEEKVKKEKKKKKTRPFTQSCRPSLSSDNLQ